MWTKITKRIYRLPKMDRQDRFDRFISHKKTKCKHKALSEKSRHEKRLNKSLFMSCHAQTPFFNKAKVNDRRVQKYKVFLLLICAWKEANFAETLKIYLAVRKTKKEKIQTLSESSKLNILRKNNWIRHTDHQIQVIKSLTISLI